MGNYFLEVEKAGLKKLTIPEKAENLTPAVVEKYLSTILGDHARNAQKIEYFLNYVDGSFQEIHNKTRDYEKSPMHNNRICENHAFALVNFKEGFLLGDRREFSQKSEVNSDDLIYLDRYLCDSGFYSKDIDIKHNMYSSGVGISLVVPRTDIMLPVGKDGARFKTAEEGYDVDNDSPFIYESLDCRYNGVVYSSLIGQRGLGDLFCFNLSVNSEKKKICTVYTREWVAQFDGGGKLIADTLVATPIGFKELPMTEHTLNKARAGDIEIVKPLLDALNTIVSNSVDNIVDIANQILVFYNTDITGDQISAMRQAGALLLDSSMSEKEAKVEKLSIGLNYADVNVLFEQIMTRCYDIVGVPLASASVTSGGDTGQARLLGGGWTNAYEIINRDILAQEQSDREVLRKMLAVCRLNGQNKVNEVSANQIDIKYNVNMRDNLLVKSQALQNLNDLGIPHEAALKAVQLFSDNKTVAQKWTENQEKIAEKQLKITQETQRSVQTQEEN
jgi:SPP1 family phage portal protein